MFTNVIFFSFFTKMKILTITILSNINERNHILNIPCICLQTTLVLFTVLIYIQFALIYAIINHIMENSKRSSDPSSIAGWPLTNGSYKAVAQFD